jgi:hypothetical protein
MLRLSFFGVTKTSDDFHVRVLGRLVVCLVAREESALKPRGAAAAKAASVRSTNENIKVQGIYYF